MLQRVLFQFRTNDAQTTVKRRDRGEYFALRHIVEVDPGAILAGHDSLGAETTHSLLPRPMHAAHQSFLLCVFAGSFCPQLVVDLLRHLGSHGHAGTMLLNLGWWVNWGWGWWVRRRKGDGAGEADEWGGGGDGEGLEMEMRGRGGWGVADGCSARVVSARGKNKPGGGGGWGVVMWCVMVAAVVEIMMIIHGDIEP